ncbi:phosphopentomutase [Mesorhizobium sp. LHD-90]|uniref:phosphopentomutase n=1 Tax=Mesorhizobium sp. LHD-90 TaxID=3071414 RepID=UPI0027E0F9C2|nr:phosphopentomutase [Mesorhizobium sp. LHD-90]MDQ6435583.1 phosphopentomutase [Mesorhizobium sp. LHD-90]
MARAFLFVLDSFGVGGAPDGMRFGDQGSDTLGHIARAAASGGADRDGLRQGPLALPVMASLGLGEAARVATGVDPLAPAKLAGGAFHGAAQEISNGKDTITGHWEIAGVPVPFDWGYFPDTVPAFPAELLDAIVRQAGLPGTLANRHASGTEVIEVYGEEHLRTGKPIVYTSVDSVIQIAAHEKHFGLARLYDLCKTARKLVDPLNIGRVIARPFVGDTAKTFERTPNRKDFAVPPPEPTILDRVVAAGGRTLCMGKIGDIFTHRGVSEVRKAAGNLPLFDKTLAAIDDARDGDLVFANFVDFDTEFGHRRDVAGYAAALEAFDRRLPEAVAKLQTGDLLLLTADHGCDPTWHGTDHTRERVPIFGIAPGAPGGSVGLRNSYADIGETVAAHLGLEKGAHGVSFVNKIAGHA